MESLDGFAALISVCIITVITSYSVMQGVYTLVITLGMIYTRTVNVYVSVGLLVSVLAALLAAINVAIKIYSGIYFFGDAN